jgi:hypothetical protein
MQLRKSTFKSLRKYLLVHERLVVNTFLGSPRPLQTIAFAAKACHQYPVTQEQSNSDVNRRRPGSGEAADCIETKIAY